VTRLHHKKPNQLGYASTSGGECPCHEKKCSEVINLIRVTYSKKKVTDIAVDDRTKHALTPCLVPKIFQDFPSHRMFGHMHEVLNVDEKKN
jgi:hypothetical protein